MGEGGAIIEGFKVANGGKIGFVDADDSVEPYDVKEMFDLLSEVDGVIASRRLRESKILVSQPFKRRIASKIFNKDVLDKLITRGFEFDVELLWRLKKRGYKIIEFPITWKHTEGSSFRIYYAPKMFFSLIKARFS